MSSSVVSAPSAWALLEQTRRIPHVSATTETLKLMDRVSSFVAQRQQSDLVTPWWAEWAGKAVRTYVTYQALPALSVLSFVVNGLMGAGKITLGLTAGLGTRLLSKESLKDNLNYKSAQGLVEEGATQLITGIFDIAINWFLFARLAIAVSSALAPEKTFSILTQFSAPFEGAIDDSMAISGETKKKSVLQIIGDLIQRVLLPLQDYSSEEYKAGLAEAASNLKTRVFNVVMTGSTKSSTEPGTPAK